MSKLKKSVLGILFSLMISCSFAQNSALVKYSFSFQQVSLKEILHEISETCSVHFSYSSEFINLQRTVSISLQDKPLKEILNRICTPLNIEFLQLEDQVVLKPMSRKELTKKIEPVRIEKRRPMSVPSKIDSRVVSPIQSKGGGQNTDEAPDEALLALMASIKPKQKKYTTEDSVQVSIFPFVGTHNLSSHKRANRLSVNVVWGVNGAVNGVELGGIANTVINDVEGTQIAGLMNTVGGNMRGTQISGLVNMNMGYTNAVQIAGLMNMNSKASKGTQLAIFGNIVKQEMYGLQVALLSNQVHYGLETSQISGFMNQSVEEGIKNQVSTLFNKADVIKKCQVSTGLNIASDVEGIQFGLINFADTVSGNSIGLLNFIRHGFNHFEMGFDDNLFLNLGLKFGSYRFYNIIEGGLLTRKEVWRLGYGIGSNIIEKGNWKWNTDLMLFTVNSNWSELKREGLLYQFGLGASYSFKNGHSLSFQPTYNWMTKNNKNESDDIQSLNYPFYTLSRHNKETYSNWIGMKIAWRF